MSIYDIAKSIKSWYFFPRFRFHLLFFFSRILNSRGEELKFVLRHIPHKKSRIVDIGAAESLLVYELAGRGHNVFALDQRPYHEKLRNGTFIQVDLSKKGAWTGNQLFDIATAVSSLEHIGYGEYGDPICKDGLENAAENIHKMLKNKGLLIATFPNVHSYRVMKQLDMLFTNVYTASLKGNMLTIWRKG